MANKSLQGEKQFHSKNYLLEMPRSHTKTSLKSAPQTLNFVMDKAISKNICTRLWLQMLLHVPALLHIVAQPRF